MRPEAARPNENRAVSGDWRDVEPAYLGTARCGECHADEAEAFAGSDHDRAMEVPSARSVEAPFDGRAFAHDGGEASFRRDGDAYVVRAEGPDGALADFPVAWTFGFFPLQQYLLDVRDGRLQALTVAWDARAEADGGARFYDLYPDESFPPGDALHWTGAMQNWNYVCADCHSTAYRKGYDAERDAYAPTWAEPDVGCEACHGPGARHAAWAEAAVEGPPEGLVVDLHNGREWVIASTTHNGTPQPDAEHVEVETCAPCHARRHQIAEARRPDQPLLDFYRPELLTAPLYHADGQIDGEVYVYGSFVQSRMFHAGVRCSDCHEPHTLELRAEGDDLCARCHDAAVYADASHHHHPGEGEGAACVSCHMPAKVYMGVDARPDHSMRIPRPDLSVALGVPNACSGCHADQTPAWAAERAAEWWGDEAPAHYGTALAAGRRGDPGALADLTALAFDGARPAIARGTALATLEGYGEAARDALTRGAKDPEPLVRLGAVYGARGLAPGPRLAALARVIGDPRRAIRVEAARALAVVPVDQLRDDVGERLRRAERDLERAERLHADRADAWLRLGVFELDRGRPDAAEAALRRALELAPRDVPARVNLADLARARGDEAAAERWLREALELAPYDGAALHALGLLEIRTGRTSDSLDHLRLAHDSSPEDTRFAYVYAVALWDSGRKDEARSVLRDALARRPFDAALLEASRAYGVSPR